MKRFLALVALIAVGGATVRLPAVAQQIQGDMQRVEVRRPLSLEQACPGAKAALPQMLREAAKSVDMPADMQVNFKLDGDKATDIQTKGYWGFDKPLRQAVAQLTCGSADGGAYAVSFLVTFQYDASPEHSAASMYSYPDARPARNTVAIR